ncbi:hypothetical protein AB2B41_02985 [Marimonas sp. MJW-29]|uniref:Uncharacterized protein n=1 Tax=Sulfitobacter sediminis TaxID=3234186 RepID=A0ABV3RI23_9RHOB
MTTVTQDQEIARGEELLDTLRDAVTALRRDIEEQTDRVQSGETNVTEVKITLNKLREMMGYCAKMEVFLNDCRSKQAGIATGGYALDLDRARVEIGCKLDRLRRCGRPRAVPE